MKALKNAERPPAGTPGSGDWSLEPMDPGAASGATPRTAQAAADLIRSRESSREGVRLAILLGVLVFVVVGMGGYFYVAVYMPWLLLPKPAVSPAPATSPIVNIEPEPRRILEASSSTPFAPPGPLPSAAPELPPQLPSAEQKKPVVSNESKPVTERPARVVVPATAPVAAEGGLLAAYELLQSGQYEQARQAYEKLRVAQPGNPDVLLGLAVIAQRQHRTEEAAQLYLRAIEIDPQNGFAQAGLVAIIGKADPAAAETRLKQLVRQQPAAYLHFALGNVYAGQGRWSEAQSSYFEAQRMAPESPDYAFNLAVSLEHLGQTKAAADYYQRALRLAQGGAATGFDSAQARRRLQVLSRQ